ncbi:putative RNA-binding protein [Trypanosoma vivax]|nr:putative RNA-binding protein [Trypanosoma vivax]
MPGARNLAFTPLADNASSVRRAGMDCDEPISLIIDNTCRVFISHIPHERIERDGANALRSEFEAFGPVEAYRMFTDKSGRFTGSVLCTYRNPADASAAVQHMNNRELDGGVLKVSLSRDHGVVLLHNKKNPDRRDSGEDDGDGKWKHDMYLHDIAYHDDARPRGARGYDDRYGHPGGGRGNYNSRRGGYGGRGYGRRGGRRPFNVDEAFERYIASRDMSSRKNEDHKGDVGSGFAPLAETNLRCEESDAVTDVVTVGASDNKGTADEVANEEVEGKEVSLVEQTEAALTESEQVAEGEVAEQE